MSETTLDSNFWNALWIEQETKWDIGYPSPAIAEFIDTINDTDTRILIPGCGNAYEAEYLHRKGFRNVVVVDFAPEAIRSFAERVPDFPKENLVCADFFELKAPPFEIIIEQTFFCAIDPSLRKKYAEKMNALLVNGGTLAGLLFIQVPDDGGPPFGGSEQEYRTLFADQFEIRKMEACMNSIGPRKERELWIELRSRKK